MADLTTERIDALLYKLNDLACEHDRYEYGLPLHSIEGDDGPPLSRLREAVRAWVADGVPASDWSGTTEPKLLWCRQCGEGVQPGLCRRPKGTEQPAECAAIAGVPASPNNQQEQPR